MSLNERFRRPWRRSLLMLGLALSLAGCKVELYNKLSERSANDIVSVLLENGIEASRQEAKDGTLTVMVEEGQFSRAVKLLKAHGLPNENFETIGEIFSGEGLISSPFEERARLIYALSQELSRTISDIDGVLSARIHVVLPDNDPLSSSDAPSSASVFIRHQREAAIGDLTPQIKMFVANSIEGLVYKNVSVVLVPVDVADFEQNASENFEQVAGLWVHKTSAAAARFLIYALAIVALLCLLGIAAVYWWFAMRREAREPGLPATYPIETPAE